MIEGVRFEDGDYGRRAVITSAWSGEMTNYLLANDVLELELNDGKGWRESTKILDGDLTPLLRQKHLSRVSFKNRRHYSHKREEFGGAYSK